MLKLEDVKLAIVGLGYVGLPLAVEFGKKMQVVGFDISQRRIDALKAGHDSTLEVSDDELKSASELSFSSELAELAACNVFIVTVPTPIDEHKRPDLTPLIKASESIGSVLKKGDIVIYESTVYPGATEEDCVPVLERVSGLKFNVDFLLAIARSGLIRAIKSIELLQSRRLPLVLLRKWLILLMKFTMKLLLRVPIRPLVSGSPKRLKLLKILSAI